jgi:ribosomal protein S27E
MEPNVSPAAPAPPAPVAGGGGAVPPVVPAPEAAPQQQPVVQPQPTVVNTNPGAKNDLNRCPSCGSTNISFDTASGKLKCDMCRALFDEVTVGSDDVRQLQGEVVGSGATAIIPDVKDIMTFKCSSCGAEIVIDTSEATSARCHWCRHSLSVNEQIPNGAVPDMVLPFKIEKGAAQYNIDIFVKKRKFFAHPTFWKEFTTENVMGVYLPYMVVDVNGHSKLVGQGEHLVRSYMRGTGNNRRTYYDADLYNVSREFNILIDDLTIESSADKLNQDAKANTNNIINSIMPFDTENCVRWDANYLKGFASEKRDTNTEDLKDAVVLQAKDVARHRANESLAFYDRGVAWNNEGLTVNGLSWKAAYLPVWIYSYYQTDKKLLHYCAVNARTGETMGSVPINKPKLFAVAAVIEVIGAILGTWWLIGWLQISVDNEIAFLGLLGYTPGFIFYWVMMKKYRNMCARHKHEKDTRATMENLQQSDDFVEHRKKLTNPRIQGANNETVSGSMNKNATGGIGKFASGLIDKTAAGAFVPKKYK